MAKLNTEAQVIEGVGFFYTKIQRPSPKFNKNEGNEYVVDVHVDKATAKAWNKEFPKNKAKEYEYTEFVEKFGGDLAIGTDEQFFIKLKKNESYLDKNSGERVLIDDKYRPRVLIDDGSGELEDITFSHLVGNGSVGVVQYEINENDYGKFANLVAIKVDSLVVVQQSSGNKFDVLGKVKSLADNPNTKQNQTQDTKVVVDDSKGDDWD